MATNYPKLEHRSDQLLPLGHFLLRMLRFALFACTLISLSLLIGAVGYRWLAGLAWIDSFYMASMILTGMGPTAEMTSNGAKLFSTCYALFSGIAFLTISAVFFTPIVHRILHLLHVQAKDQDG